ncbi:MAG TPA: hypothetical protein VHI71_04150 [Actinomycetota bacterium]|nr:hypothetical protein [Actinomycetota bacterium]
MGDAVRIHTKRRLAVLFGAFLVLGVLGGVVGATSAGAQQPCDPYTVTCRPIVPPEVFRSFQVRTPDKDVPTIPPIVRHKRQRLPFTGADLTLFAATGMAALGTGTVLVRATRARRSKS